MVRYAVAAAAVGIAAVANALLPQVAENTPFFVFFAAVVAAAWYGGGGPGFFATAASVALAGWLFNIPFPNRSASPRQLATFVLGGVLVSALSGSRRKLILKERREREWLQTTLRSVGEAVIATDSDGRVTFMNTAAERLCGWNNDDAKGKALRDVYIKRDEKTHDLLENPVESALKASSGDTESRHGVIASKDGHIIPVSDSAAPIRDEYGDVIGAVLVFRDVSEPRRAEEALRASEDRYRTITETASDAIVTIDGGGIIVFANAACSRIFGYSPDELTGKPAAVLIKAKFPDEVLKQSGNGGRFETELLCRQRSGAEIPLEASFAEFTRDGKRYYTAVLRDISERKRSEEALELERARTEEALELHERLEQQVMLLVEASATLLTSLEAADVLDRLVELAAKFIKADAYAIWSTDDDVHWRALASRGLSEGYRDRELAANQTQRNLLSGPMIVEDVDAVNALANRTDGYHSEGIRSLLVIPLRRREQVSSTITFYYRQRHRASQSEVRIATALGNLAAAALTTVELYETQSRMRADAEANEQRSTFLADATSIIASSLDYEATLSTVARLAVPHFADWCGVDMLKENGELERLAVAHVDPEKVEWARELQRRYPPDLNSDRGLAKVLRTGQYEVINDVSPESVERSAVDDEHRAILKQIGIRSVLMAPLIARGRVLGALTFLTTSDSGRGFGAAEVDVALHLARRAAIAVDNADLYRTAERRRQEAENAAELLRQSNEDLEQFAYVSSHDLQEPLRMIGSYTQLLERRYKGRFDQDADEFINFVVEGVDRMQRLLRDLLEYSRAGHRGAQTEDVETVKALDDAVRNLKMAVEESNASITHGELPAIHADRMQVTQLFQNLLANAIKFRRNVPLEIHVDAVRGDGEWIFSVRDNGMGFDPAYARKVFVIFQRLHGREYSGTGIGLAICKRIVERRGGRIWVEAQPEQGATFYFSVPDAMRAEAGEPPPPAVGPDY